MLNYKLVEKGGCFSASNHRIRIDRSIFCYG